MVRNYHSAVCSLRKEIYYVYYNFRTLSSPLDQMWHVFSYHVTVCQFQQMRLEAFWFRVVRLSVCTCLLVEAFSVGLLTYSLLSLQLGSSAPNECFVDTDQQSDTATQRVNTEWPVAQSNSIQIMHGSECDIQTWWTQGWKWLFTVSFSIISTVVIHCMLILLS